MRKYLVFTRLALLEQLEYRVNEITRTLGYLIPTIGFYFLWRSLYLSGTSFGGYDLKQLTSYFVMAGIIDLLSPTFGVISNIGDEVQSGHLSSELLRPFNLKIGKMFYFLGERAFRLLTALIIVGLALWLFGGNLAHPIFFPTWIFFIISTLLSITLAYWLFFSLSIGAFWLTHVLGFAFALTAITSFLGGTYLPLDLLPPTFQVIINLLPFKYIVYFPVQIFLAQISPGEIIKGIVLQVVWIVTAIIISRPSWKLGLKRYEAVGS